MSTTMQKIQQQLITGQFSSTEDLVELPVKLYPPEVVNAAKRGLGEKVVTDYFAEMYGFAYRAQMADSGIKPAQADGVMRTHDKISKWIKTQNINDVFDMSDPDVMRVYLAQHIENMEAALKTFKAIAKVLEGN